MQQCPDFCKKKRHQICENHSDHLYKSQTTFQCRSLFPSWVIRPPIAASVPYFIFLCCFIDFHKNGTNNWKITKLSANTFENFSTSFSQTFHDVASFVPELLGFVFLYMLYLYAIFQKLIKTEQTIDKSPNFLQMLFNIRTSFSQNLNVVASFVLEILGFVFYISRQKDIHKMP